MRRKIFCALLGFLGLGFNSAMAASPTSKVGGARVKANQSAIEYRFGSSFDSQSDSQDKQLRSRLHLDYGVNDWYAFRLVASQRKNNGESFEHDKLGFHNRFQVFDKATHGFDGGFRLTYDLSDGDKKPDALGVTLVSQLPLPFAPSWQWDHNMIFGHDVGSQASDGLSFEIRNQITKTLDWQCEHISKLRVGVAMFNDFGNVRTDTGYANQQHEIRPFVKASFHNGLAAKVGYGVGISDANPNQVIKFSLGKKF